MASIVSTSVERGKRVLDGFTLGQKVITVLAVVGLLMGGFFFLSWAQKPSYAPLFTSLASSDASAIVDKLNATGTPYQLSDGGQTILVPQDKVYGTRLAMSSAGLPAGDKTGYALMDKAGLTTSDFQQHVEYQRALEGELAKTIESIQGVTAAVVHVAIPKDDVFATDQNKPTASVLVSTAVGTTLTTQQVQAIVHLVASSIEGMSPDDVTVADSTGKVLSVAGENGLDVAGDARSQAIADYQSRMSSDIQSMIDRVVGPGHAAVKVTADLSFDRTTRTTESFTAKPSLPPLSSSSSKETYSGNGTPVGGVLGPDNNGVPTGTGTSATPNTYSKQQATVDNAVDKTTEQSQLAPGSVRRLSVAVLLDSRTAGTLSQADVQKLVSGAAGVDAKRGDSVVVTQMPFDTSAAQQAKADLKAAEKANAQKGMFSLIKVGALGLLVLAVLVIAFLSSRRTKRTELTDVEKAQLEDLRRRLSLAEAREPYPALESGDPVPALPAGPGPDDSDALRRTKARDEIADLVDRQPEEVAQLLRGWLADRRS